MAQKSSSTPNESEHLDDYSRGQKSDQIATKTSNPNEHNTNSSEPNFGQTNLKNKEEKDISESLISANFKIPKQEDDKKSEQKSEEKKHEQEFTGRGSTNKREITKVVVQDERLSNPS